MGGLTLRTSRRTSPWGHSRAAADTGPPPCSWGVAQGGRAQELLKLFISGARNKHTEEEGGWGVQLALAGRRFLASTQRGIGPPRQSEPLNFELLLTLTFGIS